MTYVITSEIFIENKNLYIKYKNNSKFFTFRKLYIYIYTFMSSIRYIYIYICV